MLKVQGFSCTGADLIIDQIKQDKPEYTHAYLDTYPLTDEQVQRLANAIKVSKHLQYLNLFDCNLNESRCHVLLEALKENRYITEIVINHEIGDSLYQKFKEINHEPDNQTRQFRS